MASQILIKMSVLSLSIGQSKNPVQEALLIKAQSRIVQLESEVSTLRQEAMVDKVKQDFSYVASVTDVERQNQVCTACREVSQCLIPCNIIICS